MIAGAKSRLAAYILAGLVLVATLADLLPAAGAEPVWYQLGSLLLTVPRIVASDLRPRRT